MTISLIYDFITYENHYWMTVVSLFFLVVFIFWLTVHKFKYFMIGFIKEQDIAHPLVYNILKFFMQLIMILMFTFDSVSYDIFFGALITIQIINFVILVKDSRKLNKIYFLQNRLSLLANGYMVLLML